ncbi:MAG: nicotinate phosphoribosyltransferase [Bacteroidota bacterium]
MSDSVRDQMGPTGAGVLHTDYYQLTMLAAYRHAGLDAQATFDLFVRRLPEERRYLVACGVQEAIEAVETLRFSADDLAYLRSLDAFSDAFLDELGEFRFSGDIEAVREGQTVFGAAPILRVTAPIAEAQLVETFLLNQITFQTNAASKGARVVEAAQGRPLLEFGLRRMHGLDAGVKIARAMVLAGFLGTSNVAAGSRYGLRVAGTMAHSYIEAHPSEAEAFISFTDAHPGTTLLVDTYGTLEGVRRAIELHRTRAGFQFSGIRLDSGDLAELARGSRALLDDAGLTDVRIVVSGGLDEYAVADLVAGGAPIDAFGVGTRVGTMADRAYLDSVYKLAAYAGAGRMKLAEGKRTLPGVKQVFRTETAGQFTHDTIALAAESCSGTPLLEPAMRSGRMVDSYRSTLEEARTFSAAQRKRLPDSLRRLNAEGDAYPVRVSERLQREADDLAPRLRAR